MMSDGGDAVRARCHLRLLMGLCRMFEGLPRVLMSRQVNLLPVFLGHTMGMRGEIVQFGGSLMILVV
jgi:hypothetical protein